MSDFQKKINNLNWLKAIGVEYYCSQDKNHSAARFKTSSDSPLKVSMITGLEKKLNEREEGPFMQQNLLKDENSSMQQSRILANSVHDLESLRETVINFEGCDLKKLATNTVFSDGNPGAPFMFVGEAPGATEDKMGIPFCGESGKLLDNILQSIGISRTKNAYITNTVYWRPPANRAPTQLEVDICRPFVEKHIALIKPKLIILVGSVAATCLLGKHAGISKIRQEYYSYSNQYLTSPIPTTALFHPAYLLRQPMQKKTTWSDLLKIEEFAHNNRITL